MSFDTFETSQEDGQLVELLRVEDTRGVTGIQVVVAADDLEGYADTAALLPHCGEQDDAGVVTITLDDTVSDQGTKSMKLDFNGPLAAGQVAFGYREFPGFTPGKSYPYRARARFTGGWSGVPLGVFIDWNGTAVGTPEGTLQIGVGVNHDGAVVASAQVWLDEIAILDTVAAPGASTVYRLALCDVPIVYDGETYAPAIAERDELTIGSKEAEGDALDVVLPRTHEVAQLFAPGATPARLMATLIQLHRGDLASARTPIVGRLARPRFKGPACTLRILPAAATLSRKLPVLEAGPDCPYMVYDAETCQADPAPRTLPNAAVTAITSDASGYWVTVSGAAAKAGADTTYFQRGLFVPPAGPRVTIMTVDSADGDRLQLLRPVPGLAVGMLVTLIAGCDQSPEICRTRHDNLKHFGGHKGIPPQNPAAGWALTA